MDRNSNAYTFLFSIVMVVVVAGILAFLATSLADRQAENVKQEKMQNILFSVGVDSVEVDGQRVALDRPLAEQFFAKYITQQIAVKSDGSVDSSYDADNVFNIDLKRELKKDPTEQAYPLYVANVEGSTYYVVPLRGKGLWDAIWGYVSLDGDANTVRGAIFDHKGETPGLGAEIKQNWFRKRFVDEKIMDASGNFVGIDVQKGYSGGNDKNDNAIDAISGATITGDGVTDMIKERFKHYLPYFKSLNTKVASN